MFGLGQLFHSLHKDAVVAVLLVVLSASAQTPTDVRMALVIGNSAYPRAPLLNPTHDAQAMGAALRRLGFAVTEVSDGNRDQMLKAVARLRDGLQGKHGVGMVYYAGHGVQVDWHNYMIPIDASLRSAADVIAQGVDLNVAVDALRTAGSRINILVLDACRNNPFAINASGKGLAPMDAPPGTFLAYATAPGNVAEDGDAESGNGLYTKYLLEELGKPASRIEDVFKRVRLSVRTQSEGRQIPWESTSLEEDFSFSPTPMPRNDSDREAEFAREFALWQDTRAAASADAFLNYLRQYPSGHFAEIAQARLDRLQAPSVRPQFRPGDPLANTTTTERFRQGDSFEYRLGGFGTKRFVVSAIRDGTVEVNQGERVLDLLGNIQERHDHKWRDAQFYPAEYSVGKKWSLVAEIETSRRTDTVDLSASISARERAVVPAGEFETFRVEVSGTGKEGHKYVWTFWMNPKYGMPIKWIETRRNPRGRFTVNETWELTALNAPRD